MNKYSPEFRRFYGIMRKYIPRIHSGHDYVLWYKRFLDFFEDKDLPDESLEKRWLLAVKRTPHDRFFAGERAPTWWWQSFMLHTSFRDSNWRKIERKRLHAYLNGVMDSFAYWLPPKF